MYKVIIHADDELGKWASERLGFTHIPGALTYIGLTINDEIVAVTGFEKFNGTNCIIHVAAVPGKRWCQPFYLDICFWYAFEQLGCTRVTGLVDETNVAARRLDEHLGFELETRLKNATPNGDLLVYVMWKDKCRWIRSKTNELGQGRHPLSTELHSTC